MQKMYRAVFFVLVIHVTIVHGYFNLPVASESQAYKHTMAIIAQHLDDAFRRKQK